MQILGIVCSPRRTGNTELLVRETLRNAATFGADVVFTSIAGKDIHPCDGCNSCYHTGECGIQDDMQAVYAQMLAADGIVLGSPVYYWDVSAQAKIVIDRTYRFRRHRGLRNKVAGAVVVAGQSGASTAFNTIMGFFSLQKMVPARAVGPRSEEELAEERTSGVIAYAYDRGDVRNNGRVMTQARALGRAMVETITLLGK
jgi:multimeric flavodoxin WrbA